jgi:hypothetical protein
MTVYKSKDDWIRNASPEPNTGCWLWTHGTTNQGYGRLFLDGKIQLAHRVSYQMFNGDIPEGMMVRHVCHNPVCFNPDHLLVGTAQDNSDDMVRANRHPRSCLGVPKDIEHKEKISIALKKHYQIRREKNIQRFKKCKITLEDAKQIRQMFADGVSAKQLSQQYGYSNTTEIYRIVNGQRWNYA